MANDAWDLLHAALTGFAPSDFDPRAAAAIDAELAAWIAAHPGRLEAELPARVVALAAAPGAIDDHQPTQLAVLLGLAAPDTVVHAWERRLDATLRALDPIAMLGVVGQARRDHLAALGAFVPIGLAAYVAGRAGEDAVTCAPIAPELRDHLRALLWQRPLPDVLPRDLHTLSPRAIEARVAAYLDLGIDALTRRLRGPDLRFLAPGEGLGDVIARDAATLHGLGVDRHALADRLAALLADPVAAAPLAVHQTITMGHHQDPLHLGDVYPLHLRGSLDCQIGDPSQPAPNSIRFGDLLIETIRRAGFFEGAVPYRLDPGQAVRVLGLVAAPPRSWASRAWSRLRGG